MKNSQFKDHIYKASVLRRTFKFDYSDMISRNGGRPLFRPFKLMVESLGFRLRASMTRLLWVYICYVYKLYKSQGRKGAVLHLKALHIGLMQVLGGYVPKKSASPIRYSRTGSGLPRVIPIDHRKRIRANDGTIIRLWLSLFSLFRVLDFEGLYKFETIYKDSSFSARSFSSQMSILKSLVDELFLEKFYEWFSLPYLHKYRGGMQVSRVIPTEAIWNVGFYPISKSAPGTTNREVSTHPRVLRWQAVALAKLDMLKHFFVFSKLSAGATLLHSALMNQSVPMKQSNTRDLRLAPILSETPYFIESSSPEDDKVSWGYLGKLGTKIEAAGKIRVFAMVDAWTQWMLNPLHKTLFKALSTVSTDGTFDQLKPLKVLVARKYHRYFSYDLTAATDRLPVLLQELILQPMLGFHEARTWRQLLVDRFYWFSKKLPGKGKVSYLFRYKVGQPMGALSSWAMLALTHHFIVQLCWWRLGWRRPFEDYAVLGDDIVICNNKVAKEYLRVMDLLGVECNLSKSLVSRHSLEFAKRYYFKGEDLSPLSFKEINAQGANLRSLPSFQKKWGFRDSTLLSYLLCGYRLKGTYTSSRLYTRNPVLRAGLLYMIRSRLSPLKWFCSVSLQQWYDLDQYQRYTLQVYIWDLYRRLIRRLVNQKAKSLVKVLKEGETDGGLTALIVGKDIIHWDNKLKEINAFLDSSNRELMWRSLELGYDGVLYVLRQTLEEVNSCPDFAAFKIRREDDEKDDSIEKETFQQECAIWLSVQDHLIGKGLSLVREYRELELDRSFSWLSNNEIDSGRPAVKRLVRQQRRTDFMSSSYPFNVSKPDNLLWPNFIWRLYIWSRGLRPALHRNLNLVVYSKPIKLVLRDDLLPLWIRKIKTLIQRHFRDVVYGLIFAFVMTLNLPVPFSSEITPTSRWWKFLFWVLIFLIFGGLFSVAQMGSGGLDSSIIPFALPVYSSEGYEAALEIMRSRDSVYYRPDFAVSPFLHQYGGLMIDGVWPSEYS